MTIQAGDILTYNGEKTTIATEPLKPYLETRSDVGFIYKTTALVRGYVGRWEIKSKKLYLVSLVGFIENNQQVDLNYLFPKQTKVFASWYSGDIRIPEGELLKKINLGYASIFEKDRILTFKEGLLIGETVKDNTTSENLNQN